MNFAEILSKINEAGLSDAEITRRIGAPHRNIVHALKKGYTKCPNFDSGQAIMKLYEEEVLRKEPKP